MEGEGTYEASDETHCERGMREFDTEKGVALFCEANWPEACRNSLLWLEETFNG